MIAVLLLVSGVLYSQGFRKGDLFVQPYVKYRQEELRWSIAGDIRGQAPNILSELIWKKLRGPEIGVLFHKNISGRFSVQMDMSYMGIVSGQVSDADYREDNRQGNFYYEKLRADKGYVLLSDARVQYHLHARKRVRIIPFLGFTNKCGHLYLLDNGTPLIEGKELKSSYSPHWYGGFAGSAFLLDLQKFRILFEIEGDFLKYRARANWNLKEEFAHPVSFKHSTSGGAIRARLFIEYPIHKKVYITFNADISSFKTGRGTDKAFYRDGTDVSTRLNPVTNQAHSVGCGLRFKSFH